MRTGTNLLATGVTEMPNNAWTYYYQCSNCRAGAYREVRAEYGNPYRCPRCRTPMRFIQIVHQPKFEQEPPSDK